MKGLAVGILCFCLLWVPAGPVFSTGEEASGAPADVNQVLSRLEERMSGLRTLKADFIQEKHLLVLDEPLILSGTILMQKPDRFSWVVREPLRYSMVIRGEVAYQWDEDTRRVEKLPLSGNPVFSAAIRQLRNWLSGAYASMLGEYTVTLLGREPVSLEFIPRDKSLAREVIDRVTVVFDRDEHYIRQIQILEKRGDRTLLTFVNTRLNGPIAPSAWKVEQDVR
jgi:outer membrane lipoprotein-sorting protein